MRKSEPFLNEAMRIAREAGNLLLEKLDAPQEMGFKGEINPVTAMDILCEKHICEGLQKAFPAHGILAEEGTLVESSGSYQWVIDPLDGTTNYAHRFPIFGVSIALLEERRPVAGVIVLPRMGEEFSAARGEGAFLNGRTLRVSSQGDLGRSFLATGFPYNVRDKLDFHLDLFKRFMRRSLAIRRAGAASADLAFLACGRFDGFWETGLQPWDTAAGVLIIEEAGGKVSDFEGRPFEIGSSKMLLASNGLLHNQMLEVING